MDFFLQPWPWWFSGILIGLTVPLLIFLTGQGFGISGSLQQISSMCLPNSKCEYLKNHNRRRGMVVLMFVIGVAGGGWIATRLLSAEEIELVPASFYNLAGAVRMLIGGFLIGFGARYAGGCTSGHAINGMSNLNWPSYVATAFFFAGGLSITWGLSHLIFPGG